VAPVGTPDISSVPNKQVAPEPPVRQLGDPFANSASTVLRVGQLLRVSFSDVIPTPPPYDAQIRDDGTIGLPLGVRLNANGKTARELEDAIHDAYVPRYYKLLSVNVATAELFYFVGGEVRVPSRQPFSGPISVTRAIDTAGGFTDFARKSGIELRRANGEIIHVDYNKARRNPDKDPNVYSGDQVLVPKRNPFGF
jgi:polysaccharide export outer membrane protein